jgi:hypothetical protein
MTKVVIEFRMEEEVPFHDVLGEFTAETPRSYFRRLHLDGRLSRPALGVALQAADRGILSLSPRQRQVFEAFVLPHGRPDCDCGVPIPWDEMELDSAVCGYCRHRHEKNASD